MAFTTVHSIFTSITFAGVRNRVTIGSPKIMWTKYREVLRTPHYIDKLCWKNKTLVDVEEEGGGDGGNVDVNYTDKSILQRPVICRCKKMYTHFYKNDFIRTTRLKLAKS